MATYIPSPQQADFFKWIEEGTGSCILEAVAGSGKTTTLIEALKLMKGSIFFGAYNKKIADEIKERAPKRDWLDISTMHAAGFKIWRKASGRNPQVEEKKCVNIYRQMFGQEKEGFENVVCKLVSLAKQAGIGALSSKNDISNWIQLIEHFDVDTFDNEAEIIEMSQKVLQRSIDTDAQVIDFDDMIYAPLVHKAKTYGYDWVLLDEAQDTNATRRALALMMLKRGGRLIGVGDSCQAIYAFTGADSDAMDLLCKSVNATQMPLTVTYRCPKKVVEFAQQWVSHIQAHESAPDGTVTHLDPTIDIVQAAKPGDAILCRYNAPIMQLVYRFIGAGIAAKVEGREIGTSIKTLARRWKVKSFSTLRDRLENYRDSEVTKFRAKEKETAAAAVEDKVTCLLVIMDRVEMLDPKCANPIDRICQEIDNIFADNVSSHQVLLSSIHRSKGREWTKCFWIQSSKNCARMDWEHAAEKNLKYVAATRAKSELIIVPEQQ